jgi:enolase-phosphatase E1
MLTFSWRIITEAEAAHASGMYAVLVDRPGNAHLSDQARDAFAVVEALDDLPALEAA